MKIFAVLAATLVLTLSQASAEIKHRFVCVDNSANKLIYVNQMEPAKGWSVSIPGGSRDAQLVDGDKILVGHGNGAAEYSLADGKVVWQLKDFKRVQTARRMKDGNTLLGLDGGPFIVVDRTGKKLREIKLPKGMTGHLRLARILDNGNILYGAGKQAVEANQDGKVLNTYKLACKAYTACRMKNGNTLATAGGVCQIQEFDKEGKCVGIRGGKKDHEAVGLAWFSGFDLLPNGNVVVANWQGHGYKGDGPHVIEFDPKNKVVWTWAERDKAKTVTNVLVLE